MRQYEREQDHIHLHVCFEDLDERRALGGRDQRAFERDIWRVKATFVCLSKLKSKVRGFANDRVVASILEVGCARYVKSILEP